MKPYHGAIRPRFVSPSQLWTPPTDIYETREKTIIRVEAAGVPRELVSILAEGRRLIIRGRRPEPPSEDVLCFHLSGVRFGPFERVIEFSFPVRLREVELKMENGFLILELPKRVKKGSVVLISVISEQEVDF